LFCGASFGLHRFFLEMIVLKQMMNYLKPYWKGILFSSFAILISTACDLLLPTIMSDVLNQGVHGSDLEYILICCGRMLAVALIGLCSVLLGTWFSTKVVAGYCADLRREVFRKVNLMTFEEFGKLGTAALVTRATQDVETVSWVASELSGTVMTIPVLFFGGVVLSMQKDVMLSLMLLAFVPLIVVIVVLVGKKILPLWDKSDEYIDRQNDLMRQRLRGIRVIRAFDSETQEHERIAEATRVMAENIIKSNVSMGLISPVATFLLNAAAVLIVYFGSIQIQNGSGLTGGDVFAIVQYVALVSSGVIMGAFSLIMFPHAKVAAGRIGQVLNAEGMADPIQRQDLTLSGDVRFENVCFMYDGAAEYALKDVSLDIKKGERIAVIGGTGAGKSTVVSMLLGFRMPTQGTVYLDGIPTTRLSRHTMRQNISCVLQYSSIYSGTIRENVKMGAPGADEEQLRKALADAQALEFVDGFSDGLDHELKQSGKNLSGGQKQRVSIGRALLKNASIYVFDDSFSALDFLTEYKLRKALERRTADRTQIVITQRVSSAMHADRIYVLDKGTVVGSGTHDQLLQSCSVYRQIHASQTGGVRS